eukprot:CAMPEP_0184984318 /NCGR_PEP_ID=MMETSP1098-20130426/13308_1 /TAXON_ID=89044 /ORGANISM="Spumella elongata, Strain CCAP 955/1" /LENGTH=73 /DNA_ID=CAMNT_0027508271 /DNA_START=389 /DNA_END=607 /DNA_ORIENTATION=-
MVEQMVESRAVSMAARRVENSAGLTAVRWAVCSAGRSVALTAGNLVTQWAENWAVWKAALMAAGWVAPTAALK